MSNIQDGKFQARILVAEDDHINLDIATRTLQKLGCEVITADNGAIATLLLALEEFDMILMDCEMPQMDGLEATKLVREMESLRGARRRIPIIALTAHSSVEAREKCLAAGMDDFVGKPFTRAQLTQMLERWLGQAEKSSEPHLTVKETAPLTSNGAQAGPLDTNVLTALFGSKDREGASYLIQLLGRFEKIASGHLATMREKYQDDRPDDLWRIAHTLRSSAGAVGATKLASRAAEVEHLAKEHKLSELDATLSALEKDLGDAVGALRTFVRDFDARSER
jgi:two-component system sensor histidine kinase/response regulator